jgi:cell division transport system permease protein
MYNTTQMRYMVRESLVSLQKRKLSGTVAVLIMGSSLLTLAIFSLVTINLDRVLQALRGEIDLTVYLQDDIHHEDQARLQGDLLSTRGVTSVHFVSREQALENFRAELGEDADLLDALRENPLPASYQLRLDPAFHDVDRLKELTGTLEQYPGVEQVVGQVEWIQRLDRMTRAFVVVDMIIGLLVLISALFVISNTVRLTIEESATTVEIMKLVGATNWFIQLPYLLGGALQGAAAGALAMLVLSFTYRVVQHQIDGVYFFASGQMLGFVLLSTLLGAGGSLVALRRHLQL